jgi:hypothetical protein
LVFNGYQTYEQQGRTWDDITRNRMLAGSLVLLVGLMGMLAISWWSLLLIGVGVKMMLGGWTMPVAWSQNAARAGGELPDPLALSGLVTSSATLFGLLAGLAWITPRGGYRVAPQVRNRILQYLVGLVGVGLLYLGLKVVFPSGDDLVAYTFRFVRYTLVSFWVTGLAPFIFLKLNLSE